MTQFTQDSLWLSFKLDNADYCVLSDYIESIQIPGKIDLISGSAPTIAGITQLGDTLLTVIELRTVFGRMNLADYTAQFAVMKDMHIAWIEDLERFVHEGGEFNKPVDPHKCKFGLWFDNFHTDNYSLNHILKKLSTPHEAIHHYGAEIKALLAIGNREQAQAKLADAKRICNDEVIPMLDQLIEIYREVNRGIILVVNDGVNRAGLLVDEVSTLIHCHETKQHEFPYALSCNSSLRELIVYEQSVFMEINVEAIIGTQDVFAKPAAPAVSRKATTVAIKQIAAAVETEASYLVIDTTPFISEVYSHKNYGFDCNCGCSHNHNKLSYIEAVGVSV